MSHNNLERFDEQYAFLKRVLEVPGFRLIFLESNAENVVSDILKQELGKDYPDRKLSVIKTKGKAYREIIDEFYAAKEGFVFITDFFEVLKSEELMVGFNQRRDKFAEYPIALFLFLQHGDIPLCVKKMPDLWSYRTYLMDLKYIPEAKDFKFSELNFGMINLLELERISEEEREKYQKKVKTLEAKLTILKDNIQDDFQKTNLLPELISYSEKLSDYAKTAEHTEKLCSLFQKIGKENSEWQFKLIK